MKINGKRTQNLALEHPPSCTLLLKHFCIALIYRSMCYSGTWRSRLLSGALWAGYHSGLQRSVKSSSSLLPSLGSREGARKLKDALWYSPLQYKQTSLRHKQVWAKLYMNLHDNYRLLSKFLLKGFGWLDSSSILLWEDRVEMQSKTSVAQPTKMADNLVGPEEVHQPESLAMCPGPKSAGVFIRLLILLGS